MKGFSLVEVIMGVFIAGIMVLVIANIPQAVKLITGSRSEAKVREVTAKIIEDLRLSGYDSLSDGSKAIVDPRLNSLNSVSGVVLTENCPVEICTSGEIAKKVTITITWNENIEPKRFSVTTLIAKGGLK